MPEDELSAGRNVEKGRAAARSRGFVAFLVVATTVLSILVLLLVRHNATLRKQLADIRSTPGYQALVVGDPAGAVFVRDGADAPIRLEFNSEKRRVLLFLYRTDCGACSQMMGFWNDIANESDQARLRVVGIRLDPPLSADMPLVAAFPSFVLDPRVSTWVSDLQFVPATVLLDRKGNFERAWFGALDETGQDQLLQFIRKDLRVSLRSASK